MISPTGNRQVRSAEARCASRAFTLVELILVMAMLLIVLAVSAPSLAGFFRGRTLASEARRFVSLTRYGQSRAVSDGVPMVLWVDPKERRYGLQQEAGYAEQDVKAVEFELGRDLQIEMAEIPASLERFGQSRSLEQSLPLIRFLPEGFIGESSPESVLLREGESGETIWVTKGRNRLHYEIQTNQLQRLSR